MKHIDNRLVLMGIILLALGLIAVAEEKAVQPAPATEAVQPAQVTEAVQPAQVTEAVQPAQVTEAAPKATPAKPAKKKAKKTRTQPQQPAKQEIGTPAAETVKVEEKQKSAKEVLQTWLKNLRKKINQTQSKQGKLVAVGAVRGAEQDPTPLYWKGKKSEGLVQSAELKDFNDALEPALNDDVAGSKSKLEAFISAYPNSPMIPDAQEALKKLAEE